MEAHDLHVATDWSRIVGGVGILLFGLAALLYVLWMMLGTVQAIGFDADGVRCYAKAVEMVCLKTANP